MIGEGLPAVYDGNMQGVAGAAVAQWYGRLVVGFFIFSWQNKMKG